MTLESLDTKEDLLIPFSQQQANARKHKCLKPDSAFFENLITMDELLFFLRNQYSKRAVYSWVQIGMPYKKIRGKLWFPKKDVELWLERSS